MEIMYWVYVAERINGVIKPFHIVGSVSMTILMTYSVIYDEVKNDILNNIINHDNYSFVINKCTFNSFNLQIKDNIEYNYNLLNLDVNLLKFDIDVTKPFYLHQLIENVI